ncbi:MAG TPA: hypothetical protein DD856_17585 [Sulfobacillus sp.]|nr:hypothetical protein [Sulfobacillus sp.]
MFPAVLFPISMLYSPHFRNPSSIAGHDPFNGQGWLFRSRYFSSCELKNAEYGKVFTRLFSKTDGPWLHQCALSYKECVAEPDKDTFYDIGWFHRSHRYFALCGGMGLGLSEHNLGHIGLSAYPCSASARDGGGGWEIVCHRRNIPVFGIKFFFGTSRKHRVHGEFEKWRQVEGCGGKGGI